MATEKKIIIKQFNGTDYDTLYPKTTADQIDDILPAFTEADNGKVLGVVNGALAWVDK